MEKQIEHTSTTFKEFVAAGKQYVKENPKEGNEVNGIPWSFKFRGRPVTHETDECYLIALQDGAYLKMTPDKMLVSNDVGEMWVRQRGKFDLY